MLDVQLSAALLIGHLAFTEYGLFRRFFLSFYAVHEIPFLRLITGLLRSWLMKNRVTKALIWFTIGYPLIRWGQRGHPMLPGEVIDYIAGLPEEAKIAVGHCRCRAAHRLCDHPLRTDITVKLGAETYLKQHPNNYQATSKEEAIAIVEESVRGDLIQIVYSFCLCGGMGYEFVVCNCCKDGCIPLMAERAGSGIVEKGRHRAQVDRSKCQRCGECVEFCPFEARVFRDEVEIIGCYGCGLCARKCKNGANRMVALRG